MSTTSSSPDVSTTQYSPDKSITPSSEDSPSTTPTNIGRWLLTPCRMCTTAVTTLEDSEHMAILMSYSIWDRACCILGHCYRNRNHLPTRLHNIYKAPLAGWSALDQILDEKLPSPPKEDTSFPQEAKAVDYVNEIDRKLKHWTEAWEAKDNDRVDGSIVRLNKRIDHLSPCRRDFRITPGCTRLFADLQGRFQDLEGLAQVGYRLQDVISDYVEHRGTWRLSVTMELQRLVSKIVFILKDIVWKRSTKGNSSRYEKPPPEAPVPNHSPNHTSSTHNTDTSQPPENNDNTQMGTSTGATYSKTSRGNEYSGSSFVPINKPREPQSQASSNNVLAESPQSSDLSATRPTSDTSPPLEKSPGQRGERPSSVVVNGLAPSPTRKTKRERERAKGERIINHGLPATNPCARCAKGGKTCMVPSDPQEMGTFKCGDCIKGQLGCSLTAMNPGRDDYDEAHRINCARKEEGRKGAREEAQQQQQQQHRSQGEESEQKGSQMMQQQKKKRKIQHQCHDDTALEQKKQGQAKGTLEDLLNALLQDQDEPPRKKPAGRTPLPTRPAKKESWLGAPII